MSGVLVFGFWLGASFVIYSLLGSTVAALLCHFASDKSRRWHITLVALAFACQIVSLLIYQTGAMHFWTLMAVIVTRSMQMGIRSSVRPLMTYSAVSALSTLTYFLWFKIFSRWGDTLLQVESSRGTMFTDMDTTLRWFIDAALPRAALIVY